MANLKTATPMRMRFHWKRANECIKDLQDKRARIDDALRQLIPLVADKNNGKGLTG